jgi:hypothetical protein
MTTFTLGRWLLVALVIVGLAFAAPVVSAHANDTTTDDTPTDDAPTDNTTAGDWATWMDGHMTEHMGPGSVEWMESHMGVTVDEMGQDMADGEYHDGVEDEYPRGMNGQGHC